SPDRCGYKQNSPTSFQPGPGAKVDLFRIGVGAAQEKHGRPFSWFGIDRTTKITIVILVAAANRYRLDLRLVQFPAGAKARLRFSKALRLCIVLGIGQKYVRHSIILVGVKKVSHGGVPPSSVSRRYRFGFGAFCQLKPFLFPPRFIARFDPGACAGNIEYITAALLCLRHKTQGLAAERMVGCEEVKHLVFLAFRYS